VDCVIELASSPENTLDSDYTSDCEDTPVVLCNVKLTAAVRKQLAVSIRDLMQHGLMPVSTGFVLNCVLNCAPVKLTVMGIVLNCVLNCTPVKHTVMGIVLNCVLNCAPVKLTVMGIVLNCVLNCAPVKLTINVMSWTYVTECRCSLLVQMTTTLHQLQICKQLGQYLNFSACFIKNMGLILK